MSLHLFHPVSSDIHYCITEMDVVPSTKHTAMLLTVKSPKQIYPSSLHRNVVLISQIHKPESLIKSDYEAMVYWNPHPQNLISTLQTFCHIPNILNFLYFWINKLGSLVTTVSLYRLHPDLGCPTCHLKGTGHKSSRTHTTAALAKQEHECSASHLLLHNLEVFFQLTYLLWLQKAHFLP